MLRENEDFPNAFQAFLLVLGLISVERLIGAVFHDVRNFLSADTSALESGVVILANGCIFTFVLHFKKLGYRELFHSSSSSAKATFLVLLLPILLLVPILIVAIAAITRTLVDLFPMSAWESAMFERMGSGSPGMILLVCVLGPVLEEMLFRGVILRSFLHQYSTRAAILGSAALFGFAHMNIYQFAAGLIAGTILGWLYERTRSLIPCVTLHCTYNSALTAMSLSNARDPDASTATGIATWLAALLAGTAGIYLLRHILSRSRPQQ